MGRRARRRGDSDEPVAATAAYTDADGNTLVLRGSLSARTRARYARVAKGQGLPPGATREDAWQRSVEFLFEHLAVSWSIAGTPALTRQSELLGRLRFASPPSAPGSGSACGGTAPSAFPSWPPPEPPLAYPAGVRHVSFRPRGRQCAVRLRAAHAF